VHGEALAIDIGGTKLSAAWIDGDGAVRGHRVVPTPPAPAGAAEVPWQSLRALIDDAMGERPDVVRGIGIGSAGPIDAARGTVSPVNIPAWRAFPLHEQVRAHAGGPDVRLAGDGICATIGEHWVGAGRGSRHMLGVVVSTGVGGGLILNGRLHHGRTANAGHIGHMVVDVNGEPCPCGSAGCVEGLASGPAMVRWARANGWAGQAPATNGTGSEPATARDLVTAARAGDPVACAAVDRAARALAAAFVSIAAACDLDRVVIGGGVARAGELLFTPIRDWTRRLGGLAFVADLTIAPAALQEHAGLIGAAALVHEPATYAYR
jgi:glucokinase